MKVIVFMSCCWDMAFNFTLVVFTLRSLIISIVRANQFKMHYMIQSEINI